MYLQLWPLLVSVPIEIEDHAVPYFKAPANCKLEKSGLEYAAL